MARKDTTQITLVPVAFEPYATSPADPIVKVMLGERDSVRSLAYAKRALQLDPECIDAHLILALHASNKSDALAHYRDAMRAGTRIWHPIMEKHSISWWENESTRPYMRAILGAGRFLLSEGRHQDARTCFEALLSLDPEDAIGAQIELDSLDDLASNNDRHQGLARIR